MGTVSEELNSVETRKVPWSIYSPKAFQKNLIVWKLITTSFISTFYLLFQKDLIVWKPPLTYMSIRTRRSFQKDLIVWKLSPPW